MSLVWAGEVWGRRLLGAILARGFLVFMRHWCPGLGLHTYGVWWHVGTGYSAHLATLGPGCRCSRSHPIQMGEEMIPAYCIWEMNPEVAEIAGSLAENPHSASMPAMAGRPYGEHRAQAPGSDRLRFKPQCHLLAVGPRARYPASAPRFSHWLPLLICTGEGDDDSCV